MVFRRRDRRPIWRIVAHFFWPRGGWVRAFLYVKHRLHRLPDAPHRIARGVFCGIAVSFSPLFGFHFVLAAILAKLIRGNIIAAILATFVGNPITFVPIGAISLKTGYFLLGLENSAAIASHRSVAGKFVDAWADMRDNVYAIFTGTDTNWHALRIFYSEVFFPYLIGGIIPGIIAGLVGYYTILPLIKAYQNRRKGAIRARLAMFKQKAAAHKAEAARKRD